MAEGLKVDARRTALLVMDCQNGIVGAYTKSDEFVLRTKAVMAAARGAGMAVMFVRVGFRPGMPEVGTRNRLFAAIKGSPERQKMFAGSRGEIHPELAPQGDEVVVTKHRVSAFRGTDLEMILQVREFDTLVLLGIATSGVVLSTLVDAVDADYNVVVISDCCADLDPVVHDALLKNYFTRRGDVVTADEFTKALSA